MSNEQDNLTGRIEGVPIAPPKDAEKARWEGFVLWFAKAVGSAGKDIGILAIAGRAKIEEYAAAKIKQIDSQSRETLERAAAIATDNELKDQKRIIAANEEISRIFADQKTPAAAKLMQLANVIGANAEIAKQLKKTINMMKMLKQQHKTDISVVPPRDEASVAAVPPNIEAIAKPKLSSLKEIDEADDNQFPDADSASSE